MANPLLAPVFRWLGRLSHPKLLVLFAVLFLADTLTVDPLPFVDEILLGLGTLLLANWKNRKGPARDGAIEGESRKS